MASAVVEMLPSNEPTLPKVDDHQHMSIDELCMSVKSISLTGTSAEKVIEQIVQDHAKITNEHQAVDSSDEDETSAIDHQLPKLVDRLDIGRVVLIPVQNQTKGAFANCAERVGEAEVKAGAEMCQDSRTKHNEDKDELLVTYSESKDRTGSDKQGEVGTVSAQLRRCIPQEHDEFTDELIAEPKESHETVDDFVARGPPDGIPISPIYGQACTEYAGYCYENAPKYRRPLPPYVPPITFQLPENALCSFMAGGHMSVFHGTDSSDIFSEFLRETPVNSSIMSSGDFDAIMNSVNGEGTTENPPAPTEMPHNPLSGNSGHLGNEFVGIPTVVSLPILPDSPTSEFACSPENLEKSTVLSPTGTEADSGLGEEEELDNIAAYFQDESDNSQVCIPDYIIEFIEEQIEIDKTNKNQVPSQSQSNPYFPQDVSAAENPGIGNPSLGNAIVHNPGPDPERKMAAQNVQAITPRRYRDIIPKPPDYTTFPTSTKSGLFLISV